MAETVSLTVTIVGEEIVTLDDVPWTDGMNAQDALQAAYDMRQDVGFAFSLAYYGSQLGYFVEEIEQIGDQPHVYWSFEVNGTPAPTGIDQTVLSAGDAIAFTYAYWSGDGSGDHPQLAAKHERRVSAGR